MIFVALKTCIVSKHDKGFSRSGCQVEITKNVFGTRARIIAEGSFKNPFKSGCEQGTGHVKSDEAWSSPSVNNGIAFEVHSLNQKMKIPVTQKEGLTHAVACVDHSDHNAMLDSTSPLCDSVALNVYSQQTR